MHNQINHRLGNMKLFLRSEWYSLCRENSSAQKCPQLLNLTLVCCLSAVQTVTQVKPLSVACCIFTMCLCLLAFIKCLCIKVCCVSGYALSLWWWLGQIYFQARSAFFALLSCVASQFGLCKCPACVFADTH